MPKRTLLLVTFIFQLFFLFSQNPEIKIIDASNKHPIPNVHICTESADKSEINFWITDVNGKKINALKNKSKVAISFIGYKTYIDSLEPDKSYTIQLIPNIEEINEVVVTGQFKPETVDKSIYNVQVINKIDIQNKAANNLSDLLINETNIKVESNGILGSNISMQGLSGEHIKILVDGIPVIGRQNGTIDLSQLNLQNIDHIEIIEGPMSVIYGSNALGGAINLISKKDTRSNYNIGTNLYYGSEGTYNGDLYFTKNYKNHSLNLTAGRNFFDGFYSSNSMRGENGGFYSDVYNEFTTNDFDPKEQYFATLNYTYQTHAVKIILGQDFFSEEIRNHGTVEKEEQVINDTTVKVIPYANDEYHYTIRTNSKLDFSYTINDSSFINILTAYSYYNKTKNTKYINLTDLGTSFLTDTSKNDTAIFNTIMSRGGYTKIFDKIELQTGYDGELENGKSQRIVNSKQIGKIASYTNLKYTPFENFSIQSGGRIEYHSKYKAPITYSFNLKYDPFKNFLLRASLGTGFRSPSLKELYLNFVDINHNIQGNPNLEPEYSKSINLSANYSHQFKKHSFEYIAKFYHTRLRNKIDFLYYENDPSRADYINIDGLYKTIGYQFDIKYKLHPRLNLSTGINHYGNSKLNNLDSYFYTTDYSASANYSNVKYRFKINIYIKHNGQQKYFVEEENITNSEIQELFIDGYNMMDFTISRPFFNDRITISTGIKNLFDVINIKSSGQGGAHSGASGGNKTMAWGRTFYIKLNFNITKF